MRFNNANHSTQKEAAKNRSPLELRGQVSSVQFLIKKDMDTCEGDGDDGDSNYKIMANKQIRP